MNLPNSITLSRIFLIPCFVTVLLTEMPNDEIWGILLFLVASLTDVLDGYIARRRRQVTTVGILLDPLADKLLISAAFISLVQLGLAPAWMVVIIIGRDFAVTGLRNMASYEGLTIRASKLGKTKMVFQVIAVCLILYGAHDKSVFWKVLGEISLWMVLVVAVWSMIHYFYRFWGKIESHRKKRIRKKKKLFKRRKKRLKEQQDEQSV